MQIQENLHAVVVLEVVEVVVVVVVVDEVVVVVIVVVVIVVVLVVVVVVVVVGSEVVGSVQQVETLMVGPSGPFMHLSCAYNVKSNIYEANCYLSAVIRV